MYDLYRRGLFGNRLRVWFNFQEFLDSGFVGTVGLRYRKQTLNAPTQRMHSSEVEGALQALEHQGWDSSAFAICETDEGHDRHFYGEVAKSERYMDLTYTTVNKTSRLALKEETLHASGLKALYLLKTYMDSCSFEDIMTLQETYPDSIIEFTVYKDDLGNCPHRNTIIWEVRNY